MKWTLGLWDGHDSGAALLRDDRIVFAVNEERLTRRKLEVGFPRLSIHAALEFAGLSPSDITDVACSTSDFAKTLTRVFPSLKEEYYQLRRRKKEPGPIDPLKKAWKYRLTEWEPSFWSRAVSRAALKQALGSLGLGAARLHLIGHHEAHAAAAALCAELGDCLVVTLDGIGDGLSGSLWTFRDGRLELFERLDGRASLGIFFEHVTNLLNMRELEDEGKVMALATLTSPIPDEQNPLLGFFEVRDTRLHARHGSLRMRHELARVLWRHSTEQFAYLAQRALEIKVLELIRNAIARTGLSRVAYAGGVASNVKLNMLIRELPEVERLFVFPHMGDGGLGLGAALHVSHRENGLTRVPLGNLQLGPASDDAAIRHALASSGLRFRKCDAIAAEAADLLADGEVLGWFEGRMEFGPRALGGRSILALPGSTELRDRLNLKLKKRSWYQPYCPVLLESEGARLLEGYDGRPNSFMTCSYRTRAATRAELQGVIGADGTCRPQILAPKAPGAASRYEQLLERIREKTGTGALLNTSFNLHGEPIVCTVSDALRTFQRSELRALVIDDYLVSKDS
ncbi:MAG: hypothetical protein NDJ90_05210 [Oligoflexia bacterium]|nr:hypothetical protein [Oligoflexia bacterium]